MARKKRPTITGKDPAYNSDISNMAPLPTNKPSPNTTPVKSKRPKQVQQPERVTKPTPAPQITKETANTETKREISITAAVKVDQHRKLIKLEAKGIAAKDAIALAGRRAVEMFKPEAKFIEKQEANRMPIRQGYKSTKRLSGAMLDTLRNQHDPLRLKSDAAMVIGQFETLFWECLDEVITELNKKTG